jgi:hypothetical protein
MTGQILRPAHPGVVPFGLPGFVVPGTKALAHRRILDHQKMPGLHIPAVGGPDGCFQNVADSRIRDGIGFQAPDGPQGKNGFTQWHRQSTCGGHRRFHPVWHALGVTGLPPVTVWQPEAYGVLVIPQQPKKIKSYQPAPSHTVGLDHSNRGKAYAGSVLDVEIN